MKKTINNKDVISKKRWEVKNSLPKGKVHVKNVLDILLENRGLKKKKTKEEFLNPKDPEKYELHKFGLDEKKIKKAIVRIKKAIKNEEQIIVYGDYDADGVCATAILWECLYELGAKVLPYIPDRFEEGYGIKAEVVEKLKKEHEDLGLIITVDNGIVAFDAGRAAAKAGVDLIISDHHQKEKKVPKANCVIHTHETGGAGIAWFFAREIAKGIKGSYKIKNSLDLAAIGTIADQIPLLGVNRSIVKYGLERLNKTRRPGLQELFKEAAIKKGNVDTYAVGFIIAPRINAMGRIEHAIDSLRILCTKSKIRAVRLAARLGRTNTIRQKQVQSVSVHAKNSVDDKNLKYAIVVSHSSYHEGVIGLAASRLVEEYWRPSIVFSKGEDDSKASARSISGFNIIEAIRRLDHLIEDGGGHPMAAGFSIKTDNIKKFESEFQKIAKAEITNDMLTRSIKIDLELNAKLLTMQLAKELEKFEPTGIGNPTPVFLTEDLNILDVRAVGRKRDHLKFRLEKEDMVFDAIAFGFGKFYSKVLSAKSIDLVFALEENVWMGNKSLQLKVKDMKLSQR